jgi:hypothetical protein
MLKVPAAEMAMANEGAMAVQLLQMLNPKATMFRRLILCRTGCPVVVRALLSRLGAAPTRVSSRVTRKQIAPYDF